MLLDVEKSKILLNTNVGVEFEFFSNHNINDTQKMLEKHLGKKIHREDKAHSDFTPDADTFKMEPDYSGGAALIELITGPLPYSDAKIILIKTLKWIKENGFTTDRSGIHLNLSFSKTLFGPNFLTQLEPLKFILDFDEDYVFKLFPDRENNVYAKSIKYVEPANKQSYYFSNLIKPHDFKTPTEKYYGVNFLKLQKNYLEFRYLGGKDYEKKLNDIIDLLDHFVLSLFNSANEKTFTDKNKSELIKILKKNEKINNAYLSYDKFKANFPNIGLLVDLDSDIRRLDMYWDKIKDKVYEILSEGGMKKGLINYDSNTSRIQIKNVDLQNCFKLEGIDIIDSKIRGRLDKCDIFNSELDNVEIWTCNIFDRSKLINCRIDDTYVNRSCYLKDCYFAGNNGIMNGTMEGGIFRKGKITDLSKFIKCEVIEYEKIKNKINDRY